jgi:hypothetical protein
LFQYLHYAVLNSLINPRDFLQAAIKDISTPTSETNIMKTSTSAHFSQYLEIILSLTERLKIQEFIDEDVIMQIVEFLIRGLQIATTSKMNLRRCLQVAVKLFTKRKIVSIVMQTKHRYQNLWIQLEQYTRLSLNNSAQFDEELIPYWNKLNLLLEIIKNENPLMLLVFHKIRRQEIERVLDYQSSPWTSIAIAFEEELLCNNITSIEQTCNLFESLMKAKRQSYRELYTNLLLLCHRSLQQYQMDTKESLIRRNYYFVKALILLILLQYNLYI